MNQAHATLSTKKAASYLVLILLVLFVFFSCERQSQTKPEVVAWDANVRLNKAFDINPDPKIIEIELSAVEADIEITPGVKTRMYTYDGLFPGPMIEANKGDTLIVHFTNLLPEASTVHWHGVELPALMDGTSLSQAPVNTGETFTYEFKLLNAATYWYHPHIMTHRQVEKGLYGALIVRDPDEDARLNLPEKELVLMFDDILLDDDSQVAPAYPDDPIQRANTQLNGRDSNLFLINGKPGIAVVNLNIGEPVRIRAINAANTKFFRFSVPLHNLYRIGGDAGLIASAIEAPPIAWGNNFFKAAAKPRHLGDPNVYRSDPDPYKGIMIVPGERAEFIFTPKDNIGDSIGLEWHDYPRGRHYAKDEQGMISLTHDPNIDGVLLPHPLMRFELSRPQTPYPVFVLPSMLRAVNPISLPLNPNVLPITFGHTMPDMNGDINFFASMVNGVGTPFEMLSANDGIEAIIGETYIWEVKNMTEGAHPFHPHGFSFQHLETEFVDLDDPTNPSLNYKTYPTRIENKDTIMVPGRLGTVMGRSYALTRLAVKFDDTGREGMIEAFGKMAQSNRSGGWVVHCHILEHANRGMMTFLNLRSP